MAVDLLFEEKLTEDELTRYRYACCERDALNDNPRAFTKEQSVEAHRRYSEAAQEIALAYEIDTSKAWRVSPIDGAIWYEEED